MQFKSALLRHDEPTPIATCVAVQKVSIDAPIAMLSVDFESSFYLSKLSLPHLFEPLPHQIVSGAGHVHVERQAPGRLAVFTIKAAPLLRPLLESRLLHAI
jgi:hypothetical protein